MERKLCTILALDVVGFSKMMATDEDQTLKVLNSRREFIDACIHDHGGSIFNTAGDSVLAEFPSPVRAVECGVQIQNKSLATNAEGDEKDQMRYRVGINIGDVMVSNDNLFGDAVNIAARLEAQAIADGICISENIYDLVSLKVKVSYEDAGELELKNIGRPIRAYNVLKCKGATRGLRSDDAVPQVKIDAAEPGSLAVMLFKNLSSDEDQEYFCEGFSEDLISAFSRFKKLTVIASNATFAYSGKDKSPTSVGHELGVRYILDGKVRKMGKKMRISASLLSAEDGAALWSHNFDTTLDDIFDIQDELVETIVSAIVGNVERDQVKKLASKKPEKMEAYDLVLQGLEYHRRSSISAENNKKALSLFTKATEVDPNYARAHAWKTCSLANNSEWFPNEMPDDWMNDAFSSVNKAIDLDPNDPEAHRILGAIKLLFEGDFEKAIFHHEKAIEICPSDTFHIARYAVLLCFLGEPEKAMEQIKRAMRIDPFCSDLVLETEGLCYFVSCDYESAVTSFKKMQIETRTSLFYTAASLQKIGKFDDAKKILKVAQTDSGMENEKFVSTQLFQRDDDKSSLLGALDDIQSSF